MVLFWPVFPGWKLASCDLEMRAKNLAQGFVTVLVGELRLIAPTHRACSLATQEKSLGVRFINSGK